MSSTARRTRSAEISGRYGVYRESGIGWIGELPDHWRVLKLKWVAQFAGGGTPSKSNADFWGGAIPWVSPKDMKTSVIRDAMDHITSDAITASSTNLIEAGALLVVVRSGILRRMIPTAITAVPVALNQDMKALRPRHADFSMRFLRALIEGNQTRLIVEWTKQGATVESIEFNLLANSYVPVPPEAEQEAIVRYVDYHDRRIRRCIIAKEREVRLLEELREVIAYRAVTRGLNAASTLKPVGAEWIGDVPEHWEVRRLGAVLKERGELNDDAKVSEVLSLSRREGVYPYREEGHLGNKKSEDISRYKVVHPDDIVMNSMNVIIGSVGLSRFAGCLSPVYYVLTTRDSSDDPHYLNAYFQTKRFQRSLVRIGNGILAHRMRIPMELLKSELIPRPPEDEQKAIVRFIEDSTARVGRAIDRARRAIDLMREYRVRLIGDVTMGRLDVRAASQLIPPGPSELGADDLPFDSGDDDEREVVLHSDQVEALLEGLDS